MRSFLIKRVSMLTFFCCVAFGVHAEKSVEQVAQLAKQVCGACHYQPSPDLLPKRSWPYVIKSMAEIAAERAGAAVLTEEQISDITAFYYGFAPEELPRLPYADDLSHLLKPKQIKQIGRAAKLPLVVKLKSVAFTESKAHQILLCDGETDTVSLFELRGNQWQEKILANIPVPSNATVADMDGDGDLDVVVSALGLFFPPTGVFAGKVFVLEQASPGKFEKRLVQDKLGRVTDAQPLDMDGDGDMDIVLAVFGGDVPGEIAWLENKGNKSAFEKHTLLPIGGALNITPVDINGDGRLDLVSFFTQEFEHILALINKGGGEYERAVLFQAATPIGGPTSINFPDMDNDGDADILFTNGDAHDYQHDPKPYHGVQWLENKGNLAFEYHEVGRFYGASYAQAGDVDGDGDMDVVASSWNNYWDDPKRQTLVWYENTGKFAFTSHGLMNRPKSMVTFELLNLDKDKSLELVGGMFDIDLLKDYINALVESKDAADKLVAGQEDKPRLLKLDLR